MAQKISCTNLDCNGKMLRVYTGTLAVSYPPMKPWIWLCPECGAKRHGGWDRELSGSRLSDLEQRIKAINPKYELADPEETIANSYFSLEHHTVQPPKELSVVIPDDILSQPKAKLVERSTTNESGKRSTSINAVLREA